MSVKDWIECGYTLTEAKALVIEYSNEEEYENMAHKAFVNKNN
tara:strand:- start:716 stop:844 length:129 start_codon:yes stop_codon:yes gene_type:complete